MLADNENKIDYTNLSYKILFPDCTFHITNILEKYGTLFSLLEGLTTRKMTVNDENVDQISFIINLMHGNDDWRLYGLRESKSEFLHNTVLTGAKNIFLDTKNSPRKGIKSFFPKNFNEYISEE